MEKIKDMELIPIHIILMDMFGILFDWFFRLFGIGAAGIVTYFICCPPGKRVSFLIGVVDYLYKIGMVY
jgi:hypothetical protein